MDPVPWEVKLVFHVFGGICFLTSIILTAFTSLARDCVSYVTMTTKSIVTIWPCILVWPSVKSLLVGLNVKANIKSTNIVFTNSLLHDIGLVYFIVFLWYLQRHNTEGLYYFSLASMILSIVTMGESVYMHTNLTVYTLVLAERKTIKKRRQNREVSLCARNKLKYFS